MSAILSPCSLLDSAARQASAANDPDRFRNPAGGAVYLDLRGLALDPLPEIDEEKLATLARIVRGLAFAAVDGAQSGHPGGSSSKTEQLLGLLASGALRFDARRPKNPGRDRVVWSSGHCTPLFHGLLAVIYETLRHAGVSVDDPTGQAATYPEDLPRFRRWGGPSGHVESHSALADTSTGASGHGFSAGLGFALLHRSCGLATRSWVIAGDAETEEGMSYEARNLAANLGVENLVVTLDYNGFGIDGPITEAMPSPYLNHWTAFGWNVIEVDGHRLRELAYAYRVAADGFGNGRPTVVLCHTTKGAHYGKLEGTADSTARRSRTPNMWKRCGGSASRSPAGPAIRLPTSWWCLNRSVRPNGNTCWSGFPRRRRPFPRKPHSLPEWKRLSRAGLSATIAVLNGPKRCRRNWFSPRAIPCPRARLRKPGSPGPCATPRSSTRARAT